MKQMNYSGNGITEVLHTEESDGYNLAVLNVRGSYMYAYVQFPGVEDLESYDDMVMDYEDEPHGGFTYLGELDPIGPEGIWIGWDYAHCDDYCCYYPGREPFLSHEYIWTIEEVVNEARRVLNAIKEGRYKIVKTDNA